MQLEQKFVYGPVWTRRFGWDLGINLLPLNRKLCTFDCVYCQYGQNPPAAQKNLFPDAHRVTAEWDDQIKSCCLRDIWPLHTTFSGNGEPTMHPDFSDVARELIAWRNTHVPGMKLALLSNGYRLHDPGIRETIRMFDEPIIKLDSAIPETWRAMNRPSIPFRLQRLIENLCECNDIIIQTMFLRGWNDDPQEIQAWQAALEKIQPREVQVYTVTRTPAFEGIQPIDDSELLSIATRTSQKLGIPVNAFL